MADGPTIGHRFHALASSRYGVDPARSWSRSFPGGAASPPQSSGEGGTSRKDAHLGMDSPGHHQTIVDRQRRLPHDLCPRGAHRRRPVGVSRPEGRSTGRARLPRGDLRRVQYRLRRFHSVRSRAGGLWPQLRWGPGTAHGGPRHDFICGWVGNLFAGRVPAQDHDERPKA